VLVVAEDLLVIGVSERTSAAAVDRLAASLVASRGEPMTILAAVLPRERSTIHLDMIFTMIDRQTFLVYEPFVVGQSRVEVYRMDLAPGRPPAITRTEGLVPALTDVLGDVDLIRCGGRDPVVREREQWLSAANVFAFAPGKIIAYDCNTATLDEFAAAGFAVVAAEEFAAGRRRAADDARLVVATPGVNLARGGGGPRCMTLPVRRAVV
jgi:arginine deiminase